MVTGCSICQRRFQTYERTGNGADRPFYRQPVYAYDKWIDYLAAKIAPMATSKIAS